MHILYLHQYFTPPDGSSGTRSYEFARRLVAAGHRVTMITSGAHFPAHYELRGLMSRRTLDGIDLRIINVPYSNKLSFPRRIWAFAKFALFSTFDAMRIRDVDLVFATSTPLTIAIPGVAAKWRSRAPMVFEVRDLWPELPIAVGALRNPVAKRLARWLERFAYRHSDAVVALSPGMRDGVLRTGEIASDRVFVIPNSCDTELFDVGPEPGRRFLERHPHLRGDALVVYAGTLGLINGVDYLVEIAAAMRPLRPGVKFLIAGAGAMHDRVEARARELGVLDENLWMMPPLPKAAMPELLSAATVATSLFVDLPEMWSNSANKFFDALASGRPVMINYGGWQAELLERSGAGIAVPPGDAGAAAMRLSDFLGDRDKLTTASDAAATLASGSFDRDRLAATLEELFRKIAQKSTRQKYQPSPL